MIVNAKELATALRGLKFVTPSKTQLPVLSCVLLEQHYGALRLMATDLGHWATVTLAAQTPSDDVEPLRVCVPVSDFYKMANALPKNAELRLEFGGDKLTAESDGLTVTLNGFDAAEFPAPPDLPTDDETILTVERERLASWEKHLRRFVSTESSRPLLNGVRVRASDLVAINGHIMLRDSVTLNGAGPDAPEYIIPGAAFRYAHKVLPKNADPVHIVRVDKHHAAFMDENGASVIVRCLEGPFPHVEQVIPIDPEFTVEVDAAELLDAVAKVKPFASRQSRRMRCAIFSRRMRFIVTTPDAGTAESSVSVDAPAKFGENAFTFDVNADYLVETVAGVESERVTLELTTPTRAVRVTGDNGTDGLFMPLRMLD